MFCFEHKKYLCSFSYSTTVCLMLSKMAAILLMSSIRQVTDCLLNILGFKRNEETWKWNDISSILSEKGVTPTPFLPTTKCRHFRWCGIHIENTFGTDTATVIIGKRVNFFINWLQTFTITHFWWQTIALWDASQTQTRIILQDPR